LKERATRTRIQSCEIFAYRTIQKWWKFDDFWRFM